jgi:hypothetical protein
MDNLEPLVPQESLLTLDEEQLKEVTGGGNCCVAPRTSETTNPIVNSGRLPTGQTVTFHANGGVVLHAPGVTNFPTTIMMPGNVLWYHASNDAPLTLARREDTRQG